MHSCREFAFQENTARYPKDLYSINYVHYQIVSHASQLKAVAQE